MRVGGCLEARADKRASGAGRRLNKVEEMHSSGSISQTLARQKAHVHTSTY